jgi:hypothetical protein
LFPKNSTVGHLVGTSPVSTPYLRGAGARGGVLGQRDAGVPGLLSGSGGRAMAVQDLGFVKHLGLAQRQPVTDLVICREINYIELNDDKLTMRIMSGSNG